MTNPQTTGPNSEPLDDRFELLTGPWVSRDPFGGWVYWDDEDHFREHESAEYRDGRPANECERSFIAGLRRSSEDQHERLACMMGGAIARNTPPERLS